MSPSAQVNLDPQPDSQCPGPGSAKGPPCQSTSHGALAQGTTGRGVGQPLPLCSGRYTLLHGGDEFVGAPTPACSETMVEIRRPHRMGLRGTGLPAAQRAQGPRPHACSLLTVSGSHSSSDGPSLPRTPWLGLGLCGPQAHTGECWKGETG